MYLAAQTQELSLTKRALHRLPENTRQVSCKSGTLWITQQDDPNDTILEAGQSFQADGHRHTIVYALANATLTVFTATPVPAMARSTTQRAAAPELVLE